LNCREFPRIFLETRYSGSGYFKELRLNPNLGVSAALACFPKRFSSTLRETFLIVLLKAENEKSFLKPEDR